MSDVPSPPPPDTHGGGPDDRAAFRLALLVLALVGSAVTVLLAWAGAVT